MLPRHTYYMSYKTYFFMRYEACMVGPVPGDAVTAYNRSYKSYKTYSS